MLKRAFALSVGLFAAACQDPSNASSQLECQLADQMPHQDLPPAPAKCAAAKGLSGDVLLCVDFDNSTLDALKNKGWDFTASCSVNYYWLITEGKLQISDFSGFKGDCRFQLPLIDLNKDGKNFKSVTLAFVHQIQIDSSSQTAQIMLNFDEENKYLLDQTTGRQPRKFSVQTISSDDTRIVEGKFQPVYKLKSQTNHGLLGWKIESIAILAE